MFKEAIELTQEKLNKLNNELNQLKLHIKEKEKDIERTKEIIKELKIMQGNYDRENYNLSTQKGICPFPDQCNEKDFCTSGCHADVCSNGFTYRMS